MSIHSHPMVPNFGAVHGAGSGTVQPFAPKLLHESHGRGFSRDQHQHWEDMVKMKVFFRTCQNTGVAESALSCQTDEIQAGVPEVTSPGCKNAEQTETRSIRQCREFAAYHQTGSTCSCLSITQTDIASPRSHWWAVFIWYPADSVPLSCRSIDRPLPYREGIGSPVSTVRMLEEIWR